MQDYQKRVVDEKADLDSRLEKLHAFLKEPKHIDDNELHRLTVQASVMQTYSRILRDRISAFTAD